MLRLVLPTFLITTLLTTLLFVSLNFTAAEMRSSTNYQLQSDSINIGGGFSSSTSYVQESTVGEIGTGDSDSTTYSLRAGYQQMQEVFISISTTGDALLTPALAGITGGTSNGSTTVTVITDSPSGYQLTIVSENSPAMQSGPYTIADYNEGSDPDFSFITGATDAHLGFSPDGEDVINPFLTDGGGLCNHIGGVSSPDYCWAGLATTSQVIAEGIGANHPSGATTTLFFKVGIGSSAGVIAGDYVATSTVTALPL